MNDKLINTLIERARGNRDTAGRLLAGQRRSEQDLRQQITVLQNYMADYREQQQQVMAQGISLSMLRGYQNFIASLEQAIADAQRNLAALQENVARSQRHLQHEQRRYHSFDTLASRQEKAQQNLEQRQERRQSDELTANRFQRARALDGEAQLTGGVL